MSTGGVFPTKEDNKSFIKKWNSGAHFHGKHNNPADDCKYVIVKDFTSRKLMLETKYCNTYKVRSLPSLSEHANQCLRTLVLKWRGTSTSRNATPAVI